MGKREGKQRGREDWEGDGREGGGTVCRPHFRCPIPNRGAVTARDIFLHFRSSAWLAIHSFFIGSSSLTHSLFPLCPAPLVSQLIESFIIY